VSTARASAAPCALPGTPLAQARAGIDACVHCGFCLQSCPTYLVLEDENDSPRGRILLMRTALEGGLALDDPSVQTHIDRCLGCRACETVCPSGVPYGQLLEATRATLTQARPLRPIVRVVLAVFSRRALLSMTMAIARVVRVAGVADLLARLPGRLGFSMAMLASTRPAFPERRYAGGTSGQRGTVTLLSGCVMEGLFGQTNRATARTLAANGYATVDSAGQRCCGALHAHAGDREGARTLARTNVAAFERSQADFIVVNAAGCGAMLKEYGHLLADDPEWSARAGRVAARVRDATELLAEAGPASAGPLPMRVAYDAPCHLLHGQRIVTPPLTVLGAIPQLEVATLPSADQCCGSAGIYNLVEPDISRRVLEPKLREIAESGGQFVVTGNPGCIMQIGAGLLRARQVARAVHPIDLLDAAYAARTSDDRHG
jgi:glycolate oxidase iron-sulfur subunit